MPTATNELKFLGFIFGKQRIKLINKVLNAERPKKQKGIISIFRNGKLLWQIYSKLC